MTFRACGSCFSLDVYPYLGFETGRQYECKSCGMISPVVIEFDNIEALKAFKDAENMEWWELFIHPFPYSIDNNICIEPERNKSYYGKY